MRRVALVLGGLAILVCGVATASPLDTVFDEMYGIGTYSGDYHSVDKEDGGIAATADGGVVVAARTQWTGQTDEDVLLLKVSSNGTTEWGRIYAGPLFQDDERIFEDGKVVRNETFPGYSDTVPTAVLQTPDYGYLIVADAIQNRSNEPLVMKTDRDGSVEWWRRYDISAPAPSPRDVVQTGKGYLVTGQTGKYDGPFRSWALAIGPEGEERWRRRYGGENETFVQAVTATEDAFVLAGSSRPKKDLPPHEYRGWAVKIDERGRVEWERHFGGPLTYLFDAETTPSGGRIAYGGERAELDKDRETALTTDLAGRRIWQRNYSRRTSAAFRAIQPRLDGGFIAAGSTVAALAADGRRTASSGGPGLGAVRVRDGGVVLVGQRGGDDTPSRGRLWLRKLEGALPAVRDLTVRPERGEAGITQFLVQVPRSGDGRYAWDVDGDGAVDATTERPRLTHTYRGGGRHQVAVTTPDGSRYSSDVVVEDTRAPTARLATANGTAVAIDEPIRFDASRSTDEGGIVRYRWDLDGDGAVDRVTERPSVTTVYEEPGRTVRVGVEVVDTGGSADWANVTIRAVVNDVPAVVVDVRGDRRPNASLTLEAYVRDEVGATNVSWRTPVGERRGRQVTVSLPAGNHTVTAHATDEYGANTSSTRTVVVRETSPAPSVPVSGPLASYIALAVGIFLALGVLVVSYRRHGFRGVAALVVGAAMLMGTVLFLDPGVASERPAVELDTSPTMMAEDAYRAMRAADRTVLYVSQGRNASTGEWGAGYPIRHRFEASEAQYVAHVHPLNDSRPSGLEMDRWRLSGYTDDRGNWIRPRTKTGFRHRWLGYRGAVDLMENARWRPARGRWHVVHENASTVTLEVPVPEDVAAVFDESAEDGDGPDRAWFVVAKEPRPHLRRAVVQWSFDDEEVVDGLRHTYTVTGYGDTTVERPDTLPSSPLREIFYDATHWDHGRSWLSP